MQNERRTFFKRLFLSGAMEGMNKNHQIAYIATLVALNVVVNTFSIPLGITQFSFTLFAAALTGILLGPLFGFTACFLGDTLGFFLGGGVGYTPWVGVAMGFAALLSALIMHGVKLPFRGGVFIKLTLVCIMIFLVSTLAINTTAGYYLWNKDSLPFWEYFVLRFFVLGQIWNSLLNYLLLFVSVPALNRLKPLKLKIE